MEVKGKQRAPQRLQLQIGVVAVVELLQIEFQAKERELQKAAAAGNGAPAAPLRKVIIPRPDVLHNYLEYRHINQYLDYIANRYAHFVKLYTLGLSHERREVRAIEINWMNSDNTELPPQMRMKSAPMVQAETPDTRYCRTVQKGPLMLPGEQGRNIVFIEAGTHAREWISITTALNCIYQLTERYMRNIEVLRKLRFVIVPLVNPDGYEYSRIKNRNWRKNRRPHKQTRFVGTDCNRNYDIFWEHGPSKVSRNTYKGDKPFSEPETRAIRNMLDRVSPNLLFFLSLHSYGQSIMYPWGYCREPVQHWRELHTLATSGRSAIKSYNGREYRTGSISCLTKRTIAGSVVDYVYGVLRAPMALVMELPARDLGFQPPVEMVSQIGHESWYGIREMCKRAYDLRVLINRDKEPEMLPLPPPLPLHSTTGRTAGGAAVHDSGGAAVHDSGGDHLDGMDEAAGGDGEAASSNTSPAKTKKKLTNKKGKKRVKRITHEHIVEMQKRSNAATVQSKRGSVTASHPNVPKRPNTTALLAARSRVAGAGDGPNTVSFGGRPKIMPYFPPSMTSKVPLSVIF